MAGWRVGMLVGRAEWLQQVLRFKSNLDSGMFLPVQRGAIVALGLGAEWFEQLNATYRARREQVFNLLTTIGCQFDRQQTGLFVWGAIPAGYADGYAPQRRAAAPGEGIYHAGGHFWQQWQRLYSGELVPAGKRADGRPEALGTH